MRWIVMIAASAWTMWGATPGLVTVMNQSLLPNNSDCNGPCIMNAGGTIRYHLANPSQAGNAIVMPLTASPNGGTCVPVGTDVTDDKGNTWNVGPSGQQSTDAQYAFIFYALNVAANTFEIVFHNAHCGSSSTTGIQASVFEVYNIAAASAADGSSCNSGSSTIPTSGSFTPTVDGDLIISYAFRSDSQPNAVSSWSAGSGFTLIGADTLDGHASQYQVQATAGAINPGFTMGSTSRWASCAIALKSGSSGSGVPIGISVVGVYQETFVKNGPTTLTLQIPCRGNLLTAMFGGNSAWVWSTPSDSNSNTWTSKGSQLNNNSNPNGASEGAQTFYAKNMGCSPGMTVTVVTSSSATGHGGLVVYDIAGAHTTAPADGEFTTTNDGSCCYQNDPAGSTLTSAPSGITPVSGATVLTCAMPVQYNTVASATNITGILFDASTYTGENLSGPEPLDQNNGWAHANLSGTSTRSLSWTQFYPSGSNPAFRGYVARCSTWAQGPITPPSSVSSPQVLSSASMTRSIPYSHIIWCAALKIRTRRDYLRELLIDRISSGRKQAADAIRLNRAGKRVLAILMAEESVAMLTVQLAGGPSWRSL